MKLSVWAKEKGIRYETAWRWFKTGTLPVPATQLSTGTILVDDPSFKEIDSCDVAVYARVSSSDQKGDLDGQVSRLVQFANKNELKVKKTVTEVGSGLNGRRPKLMKLLSDSSVQVILVEHPDRLMRFGIEYVEASLRAQGRKVLVADERELKDDLVQDMIEILTLFCARLYGRRAAKNKAKKALAAMEGERDSCK